MKRVAVIGLDAAEPWLINDMIAAGKLPTLAWLRRTGAYADLTSEATWRGGRVWETLLTGRADFPSAALFDPATYATSHIGARRKTPFYATVPNVNLLALDVPYMSLSYNVPGTQVVWGGHDTGYPRASRPQGLVRELDEKFGVHPAFHNDFNCAWQHAPSINTLTDALLVGLQRRVDIIRWLTQRSTDWNLFMTTFSEVHSAGEMFWQGVESEHPLSHTPTASLARARLWETYEATDRAVADVIKCLPRDATVVVCSMHGMEINHYDVPSMTLLPELLYRASTGESLLRGENPARWKRRGCPAVLPQPDQKWDEYMHQRRNATPWRDALRAFKRAIGWKRGRARPIEDLVAPIPPEIALSPEQIAEPLHALDWQTTNWYRPHWPRMRAFALPVFYDGRVRINLQGRERNGIVAPGDYAATCDWVVQLLEACRNVRTGGPVLASVERLRQRDPLDPHGADADLVLTWEPAVDAWEHPEYGIMGPFPFRRTGGHTNRGFVTINAPGIAARHLGQQEALDLTPTLLALLGHPQGKSILPRRVAA